MVYRPRAERLRSPRFIEVMRQVAVEHGVCIRPLAVRRIDRATGEQALISIPCGATLTSKCPPCAERKKRLRMAQCRQGWHLEEEPKFDPDEPTPEQRWLALVRADLAKARYDAECAGASDDQLAELDELIAQTDEEIAQSGMRGQPPGDRNAAGDQGDSRRTRRARSTRRRQDVPDLPWRRVGTQTLGRTYAAPDGKVFRPSMGLTLTLDTYGKVDADGTPADPDTYDYRRAARDAVHFSKLVDRFWQNIRRLVGYDAQYFASIEPQKRLAPHLHAAVRGTVSRTELRQVVAATYHQVWWPSCDVPVYVGDQLPEWDEDTRRYIDPDTGEPLPGWDAALDRLDEDPDARPCHVVKFGAQLHAEGVVAGTKQADKWIGYVAKYLTKSVGECHTPRSERQRAHIERLWQVLRYEPCSPQCPNWLRYGVQPKNARPGQQPGRCGGKAHRAETLGFVGRRVLVSRKWSGKSLADHKHEQRAWVLMTVGKTVDDEDAGRYAWEVARPDDRDVPPLPDRLMYEIARRAEWRRILDDARRASGHPPPDLSATGEAA